ncbi:MAG: hypothetical protein WDN69_11805 [Aliidongia sp.]
MGTMLRGMAAAGLGALFALAGAAAEEPVFGPADPVVKDAGQLDPRRPMAQELRTHVPNGFTVGAGRRSHHLAPAERIRRTPARLQGGARPAEAQRRALRQYGEHDPRHAASSRALPIPGTATGPIPACPAWPGI